MLFLMVFSMLVIYFIFVVFFLMVDIIEIKKSWKICDECVDVLVLCKLNFCYLSLFLNNLEEKNVWIKVLKLVGICGGRYIR